MLRCLQLMYRVNKKPVLSVNSFTHELLKWILPSLDLDMSTDTNRAFSLK